MRYTNTTTALYQRTETPHHQHTHTHCSPVLLPSILTKQVDARAVSLPLKGRTRTATFTDDMATSSLQQSSCRTTTLQATQVLGRRKSRQDKPCFCPSLGKVCRLRPHHVVARRGGFSNPPRADHWRCQCCHYKVPTTSVYQCII